MTSSQQDIRKHPLDLLVLFIAQGLGTGRFPVAPGTIGTVPGLAWFALLLWPGDMWVFTGGILTGALASVWICGRAEQILGETDPPSVVIDEIAAMPLCYGGWTAVLFYQEGQMPGVDHFFSLERWPWTLGVFLLFRLFDIWKPYPIDSSQRLPGGWGVTLDDLLAALYVNAVLSILLT